VATVAECNAEAGATVVECDAEAGASPLRQAVVKGGGGSAELGVRGCPEAADAIADDRRRSVGGGGPQAISGQGRRC
jgi:hypothetical protein